MNVLAVDLFKWCMQDNNIRPSRPCRLQTVEGSLALIRERLVIQSRIVRRREYVLYEIREVVGVFLTNVGSLTKQFDGNASCYNRLHGATMDCERCYNGLYTLLQWIVYVATMDYARCYNGMCTLLQWNVRCYHGGCVDTTNDILFTGTPDYRSET